MKFPYFILAFLIALGSTNLAYALPNEGDTRGHHDEELNERDDEQLRSFIQTKRDIELEDKDTNLSISGDVRFEYRNLYEKRAGRLQRGRFDTRDCKCVPLSFNDFDMEFNLRFDYTYGRAWASSHIQYDNTAGIERIDCNCIHNDCCGSGKRCGRAGPGSASRCQCKRMHGSGICDDVCLKRAYFGYNIWKDCDSKLDIEVGRRMLYDVFESETQFLNRMDGIVLKYSDKMNGSTWYVKGAVFIVDERTNHYAWAGEVAFYNINNSKTDLKYSIIDWRKYGKDRCGTKDPKGTKYLVSQLILTYHLPSNWFWCKPAEVYGAVLYNHLDGIGSLALCHHDDNDCCDDVSSSDENSCDRSSSSEDPSSTTSTGDSTRSSRHRHHKHGSKWGGYIGMTVGAIEKEGDWAFDVEYQYMGSRVVPWDDQSGIGLGNVREDCCDCFGPTIGFQGAHFEFLYALTDNLTIDAIIDIARSVDSKHNHKYSKIEIEAIYAF